MAGNLTINQGSGGGTVTIAGSSSSGSGTITGVTAGTGFVGGGTSGTVTLSLDPSATNYIQNTSSLQSASVFNVSSGTVSGQLTVTSSSLAINGVPYKWPAADGSSGQVLTTNGNQTLNWQSGVTGSTLAIGITIDGGGSAIVAGSTRSITIPFGCTVSSWTVLADQSGSISVHVSSCTFANYPTLSNISGAGNSPSLSSQQKNSATPSSWSQTTINRGDIISFIVDSASTVQWVNIVLWVIKT